MFAKTHVKGEQANPLFAELTRLSGTSPKWNFYKYLVARDGKTVVSRNSLTSPQNPAFVQDIEKLLAAQK
jgi:glutathione peroxidase